MSPQSKMIRLLLVDDNGADRSLLRIALRSAKVSNELSEATEGGEALDLLRGGLRPDLILLDLNMPGMDGHEFLGTVKTDAQFKMIPVVILTSSDHPEDIARSYELHCSGYIRKPVGIGGLTALMQGLETYWVKTVELPEA